MRFLHFCTRQVVVLNVSTARRGQDLPTTRPFQRTEEGKRGEYGTEGSSSSGGCYVRLVRRSIFMLVATIWFDIAAAFFANRVCCVFGAVTWPHKVQGVQVEDGVGHRLA